MRSGLDTMRKRMNYLGTTCADKWGSDGRIIDGKLRSFKAALDNSYQAEWIVLNEDEEDLEYTRYRCLINPDKLKDDYDKKILSADFELGLEEGSVFYWERTHTHWMVTLHHLEEEAYFRANIQRCDYQFEINGHKYWVYLRGPVETTIQWRQKNQTEMNDLNYSLLMYIAKNEETIAFLKRNRIVNFDNHKWKVAATDIYSNSGYIQVYLDESFDNDLESEKNTIELDNNKPIIIHKGIYIDGPSIVNVYDKKIIYTIKNNKEEGEFVVNSSKVKINQTSATSCKLTILSETGNFDIYYKVNGEIKSTLKVEIQSI